MVRLKELHLCIARYVQLYFNSKMVRLKEVAQAYKELATQNFNSKMVRLKAPLIWYLSDATV